VSTSLVVVAAGLLAGTWLLAKLRGPRPAAPGAAAAVTVVVPARNEAVLLPTLLASLREQALPPARVIVVDDGSSDATAAIAAGAGVEVVDAGPLPDGWTGKARACWIGAQLASTELLVFLDADTYLAPDGLERLVAEHGTSRGLLSVQPYHETQRAYEQLSLYFNVVAMMGAGTFTPMVRSRPVAFGPCLVCHRDDYVAVGGHRAVRDEIVEDIALARRFEEHGLPVRVLAGRDTVRFRMYPGGFRQLAEGWTKNFGAGARLSRRSDLLLTVLWVAATGSAALDLLVRRDGASAAVYSIVALHLGWMARRVGNFRWWAILVYPVALTCFLGVFARSLLHTYVRGTVAWRGRRIPTRNRAA
jgi:4,4'-diaponeurosporenoate glycosyltransferase